MLCNEFSSIPNLPQHINLDLQKLGRKNLWHGNFPKSLSNWILQEHRTDAWLDKFSIKCILALHEIWAECCAICHESTTEIIRAEDHESLKHDTVNVLESYAELPPAFECCREKVESMSSDQLRAFLCEFYAIMHNRVPPRDLSSHALNSATHYHPDISPAAHELRKSATCKRHQNLFRSQY